MVCVGGGVPPGGVGVGGSVYRGGPLFAEWERISEIGGGADVVAWCCHLVLSFDVV